MPNIDKLLDNVNHIFTKQQEGELYFSILDMKYAQSQLELAAETFKQGKFNIVGGMQRVRIDF